MGVEPTRRGVRHNGFEDRKGHRAPSASAFQKYKTLLMSKGLANKCEKFISKRKWEMQAFSVKTAFRHPPISSDAMLCFLIVFPFRPFVI